MTRQAGGETASPMGEPQSQGKRRAWTRDAEVQDITARLGTKLRELRVERGQSLNTVSERTGVPVSTLSRIENNKMAPTFGVVMKLLDGLDISWDEIVPQAGLPSPAGPNDDVERFSIYHPGDARPTYRMRGIDYQELHPGVGLARGVSPTLMVLNHRTLDEAGGLIGHPGTEFLYVVDGVLELHREGADVEILPAGGSAVFNANVPHAYLARGVGPIRLLMLQIAPF